MGVALRELKLPSGVLVGLISGSRGAIIPGGDDVLALPKEDFNRPAAFGNLKHGDCFGILLLGEVMMVAEAAAFEFSALNHQFATSEVLVNYFTSPVIRLAPGADIEP